MPARETGGQAPLVPETALRVLCAQTVPVPLLPHRPHCPYRFRNTRAKNSGLPMRYRRAFKAGC